MSHSYTRDSFAMAKERFSSQLDNFGGPAKLGRKGAAADRKRKRNRETSSESEGVTPGMNKILKDQANVIKKGDNRRKHAESRSSDSDQSEERNEVRAKKEMRNKKKLLKEALREKSREKNEM